MRSSVRRRLAERPAWLPRVLRAAVRLLLRAFFRELEVAEVGRVPPDRGGVLVSWHPNGLVDPALLLAVLPRPLTFGARHGLFKVPLLGAILRALDTVPIYRAVDLQSADPEQRRAANRRSLDALARRVADGSLAALFPEGVSHDAPHLMELKSGAARLYYRARGLRAPDAEPPLILPVGLHYDKKKAFRSRALVWFHRPLELPPRLDRDPEPDESPEQARARARELTDEIERVLHDVIHATEDWTTHELMQRARKLIRAERARRAGADPGKPGVEEMTVAFARVRAAYHRVRMLRPRLVARLRARIERYDQDLRALRLEDHELDRSPRLASPSLALLLLLQLLVLFLFAPPLLIFGYLVNWPAALAVLAFVHVRAKLGKDVASLKISAGAVAYPLTWVAIAVVVGWAHARGRELFPGLPGTPVAAATLAALLAIAGALLSVRYVQFARETLRAIRVRLTRRRSGSSVARLLSERSALHDAMVELGRDAELPGVVTDDGRVAME